MEEKKKFYIVYQITNKLNDNIYIGVHVTENINDNYFGSGSNIKKAVKQFGRANFEKIVLFNCDTLEEMLEKEKELVNDEFIKRGDTYNIILGGGKYGKNSINTVTVKDKNGNTSRVHKTDPRYLLGDLKHITTDMIIVKDKFNNIYQTNTTDLRYLSGELVGVTKGKVLVKDENNNNYMISINDPRYLSGELICASIGMIVVKDKFNNTLQVSVNDPRYLSGELVPHWQGKKHKLETRLKMSNTMKGKYVGEQSSQYGSCWIHNIELKQNKKIKKVDINQWLEQGWLNGRKMKFL